MFKASALALIALGSLSPLATPSAYADVVAAWDFESEYTTFNDSQMGPIVDASIGSGTLFGFHANPLSDWTKPAGNGPIVNDDVGSAYNANSNWGVGDYFQFSTSTVGYKDITLVFDHSGRDNGPRNFKVQYSIDGINFIDSGDSYVSLDGRLTDPRWGNDLAILNKVYEINIDLTDITLLNDASTAYFRLVLTSTIGHNGNNIVSGSNSRLDNVTVNGTPIPEPASLALLALGGIAMLGRRRA